MRTLIVLSLLCGCKKPQPLIYSTPEPAPAPAPAPRTGPTAEPDPSLPAGPTSPWPSSSWFEREIQEVDLLIKPGGDIDGDGRADFLIGAPNAGGTGQAWVVLGYQFAGRSMGSAFEINRTFAGEHPGDRLGAGITGLGDVDGDGLSDFLVGAPSYDDGGKGLGAVYLFTGARVKDNPAVGLSDAWTFYYGERGEGVGHGLGHLGDIDGDGRGDALIPARLRSYALLGHQLPNFETFYLPDSDAILTGAAEGEAFEPRVVAAGDFDLDGLNDALIAAPDVGGTGQVWVVTGRNVADHPILDMTDAHATLSGPGTRIGSALAAADLTSDGRPDPLVVWTADQPMLTAVDAGYMVAPGRYDLTETAAVTISSTRAQAIHDVASLGDIDGDGLPDIAVGARMQGGAVTARAYLFTFHTLRGSSTLTLDDADAVFEIEIDRDYSWATRVMAPGDVNGDGLGDVVITTQGEAWGDPPLTTPAKVQLHLSPFTL